MIEQKGFKDVGHTVEPDLDVSLAFIDNVWLKMMVFKKKGDTNVPHKHNHDHATLLAKGKVKLTVEGIESIFKAPCMILIHKDHLHHFEALEDDCLSFCVHGIRDAEGSIIDPSMIPAGIPVEHIVTKYGPFSRPSPEHEAAMLVP